MIDAVFGGGERGYALAGMSTGGGVPPSSTSGSALKTVAHVRNVFSET